MKMSWTNLLAIGLIALAFLATAAVYGQLPARVPTHWGIDGTIDATWPKPLGPFVLPLVMAGLLLLLRLFPHIAPHGYRIEPFAHTYDIVQLAIIAFLFGLDAMTLLAGLGVAVPFAHCLSAGIGLLFVVLGNFMGKLTPNFFVGIRTPWTLADPEVWLRTHRLAGKLFVAAGLVIVVLALLGVGMGWLVGGLIAIVMVPAAYSYVIYRQLEHHDMKT